MATVLIVEDEVALSDLVRSHLEKEGHRVQQAFDGRQALAAADRARPDLVLLDWMLPGLDRLPARPELRPPPLMPTLNRAAAPQARRDSRLHRHGVGRRLQVPPRAARADINSTHRPIKLTRL